MFTGQEKTENLLGDKKYAQKPDNRMFPASLYPKFKAWKISAKFADPDVYYRKISAAILRYFHNYCKNKSI